MDRRLRSPAGRRRIGRQVLTSTPRRHSTECWVALYRVPVGTLQGAGWHPTRCWLALYRVDGGTLQDAGWHSTACAWALYTVCTANTLPVHDASLQGAGWRPGCTFLEVKEEPMHRALLGIACAACLSAGTAAQAPTSTPSTSTGGSAASSQAPSPHVVMTGCVERADQLIPAGGTPVASTVDSLDFVLTHAQLADSPHPVTPAPTGTSGVAGTAAPRDNGIGSMYRLDGRLDTINPHVGHHVEITGTREASATAATPPSANAVNPTAANAPTIKVESVKMLGETCAR